MSERHVTAVVRAGVCQRQGSISPQGEAATRCDSLVLSGSRAVCPLSDRVNQAPTTPRFVRCLEEAPHVRATAGPGADASCATYACGAIIVQNAEPIKSYRVHMLYTVANLVKEKRKQKKKSVQ